VVDLQLRLNRWMLDGGGAGWVYEASHKTYDADPGMWVEDAKGRSDSEIHL
jgi:hypothetical protein